MHLEAGQSFLLLTQGCKVNQYETQAIREAWLRQGLREVHSTDQADVVLINSCAVTERAVLDLGKLVRNLGSSKPAPWIVITGCAVEADQERVKNLPGVKAVIAQRNKAQLAQFDSCSQPLAPPDQDIFPNLDISNYYRARAVLKIQDGCSHGCTYCIIPQTRGASVSRKPEAVLAEARRLLTTGIRELSLCGINLRHYGRDLQPRQDFWNLLYTVDKALSPEWLGQARLRLSSLEPSDLNAKALETLKACQLISPHLHISLQSGSKDVLRRMGRGHYGPEDIFSFLEGLRAVWPVFGLGADIITGFPGETEELFAQTQDVVRRLPLTYAHIFPYSERPGTAAAKFSGSVPGHIRRQRAKDLRALVSTKRQVFLRSLLHQTMTVVPENNNQGVNEFYIECQIKGPFCPPRQPILVRANALGQTGLVVSPLSTPTNTPGTTP